MSPLGRPGLRRAGARIALIALSFVAALFAAEGLLRVVSPQPVWIQPPDLYVPDPPGRYRLRALVRGTMTDRTDYAIRIVTSPDGLRVPVTRTPRPQGTARILALGDSFTFGVGVEEEETWIERLGAELASEGTAVETLNAGVPGYGAPDEVGLFERHLRPTKPDLVVLGVYLGNDLLDASSASLSIEVRGNGQLIVAGHEPTILDWLNYHSHLFLLVKNAFPPRIERPLRTALGLGPTLTLQQIRTEMSAYALAPPPGTKEGIAATDAAYGRLVEMTRAMRARVVAMIIPEHIAVNPEFWKARFEYTGLDPAAYDPEVPRRILSGLLEKNGIPALDLTDAITREESHGAHLYYVRGDYHFTTAGHALAAHQLKEFLRSRGLLSQVPRVHVQAALDHSS